MAIRAGLTRRFLYSSSISKSKSLLLPFASQFTTDAANNEPETSTTLFVAGLNKRTSTDQLHNAFSKFGLVEQVKVGTDHDSGLSRGFGFVTYATLEDSARGLEGMNTEELDGWTIFVEYARPKTPRAELPFRQTDHRMYSSRKGSNFYR